LTSSGGIGDPGLRWHHTVTINANWFALTTRSQVLTPLVVPLLVQEFVGDAAKGTYVGTMRLWALMAALLFQAVRGMLSDRSRSRWGRRRPFIAAGNLGEVVVFGLIGLSAGLEGMAGYWVLFGLFLLSMLSSNTSHAATNALIPDLVPTTQKGIYSGIKAALELPLPLFFVSLVIAPVIARGELTLALALLSLVLLAAMAMTMLVREPTPRGDPIPLARSAILRLVAMTGLFTGLILLIGAAVRGVLAW
jgi:Na+/melibiose symporter-like transporter